MKNNIKSILSLFFCISLCCCSTSESDSAKNKKQEPSLETLFGNDTTLHSGFHTTTSNDEYFDNGNIYSEDEEIQETDEDDEEEKEEDDFCSEEEYLSIIEKLNSQQREPALEMAPLKSSEKAIRVGTIEELFQTITSDVTIIINGNELNATEEIKKLPTYEEGVPSGIYNNEGSLLLLGINNLTIKGESDNPEETHIFTEDPYAHVISGMKCENLQFRNLKLGHAMKREDIGCMANVIELALTQNVEIDNCSLYGCGFIGLSMTDCRDIHVTKTEIYKCQSDLLSLEDCYNVLLDSCILRDSYDAIFMNGDNKRIEIRNSMISRKFITKAEHYPLKYTNIEWFKRRPNSR